MRMLLKLPILLSSCVLNQIQCVVSQLCTCVIVFKKMIQNTSKYVEIYTRDYINK